MIQSLLCDGPIVNVATVCVCEAMPCFSVSDVIRCRIPYFSVTILCFRVTMPWFSIFNYLVLYYTYVPVSFLSVLDA